MNLPKSALARAVQYGLLGLAAGLLYDVLALGLTVTGIVHLDAARVMQLSPVVLVGGLVLGAGMGLVSRRRNTR